MSGFVITATATNTTIFSTAATVEYHDWCLREQKPVNSAQAMVFSRLAARYFRQASESSAKPPSFVLILTHRALGPL